MPPSLLTAFESSAQDAHDRLAISPAAADLLDRLAAHGLARHSYRVAALAADVCRALRLPHWRGQIIECAALVHDVGKVGVPRWILNTTRPLTPGDWHLIRHHPVNGERLLKAAGEPAALARLVRHHHERWDGQGYPDGLAGEAIPLGSRVILACDAYDAMVVARPYRRAVEQREALARLEQGSGTQFDPLVAATLSAVIRGLANEA